MLQMGVFVLTIFLTLISAASTSTDFAIANLGQKIGKFKKTGKECVLVVALDPSSDEYNTYYLFGFNHPSGITELVLDADPASSFNDVWDFNIWAPGTMYFTIDYPSPEYLFEFNPETLEVSRLHMFDKGDVCLFD